MNLGTSTAASASASEEFRAVLWSTRSREPPDEAPRFTTRSQAVPCQGFGAVNLILADVHRSLEVHCPVAAFPTALPGTLGRTAAILIGIPMPRFAATVICFRTLQDHDANIVGRAC